MLNMRTRRDLLGATSTVLVLAAGAGTAWGNDAELPAPRDPCADPTGWRDCWRCFRDTLLVDCRNRQQTPAELQACYDGARDILRWCLDGLRRARPARPQQVGTWGGGDAFELSPEEILTSEPAVAVWNVSQPLAVNIKARADQGFVFHVLDTSGDLRPIEPLLLNFNADGSTTAFVDPAHGVGGEFGGTVDRVRAIVVQVLDIATGDLIDAAALAVSAVEPLDVDGDGAVTKADFGAAFDAFTSGEWGTSRFAGWIADYARRGP